MKGKDLFFFKILTLVLIIITFTVGCSEVKNENKIAEEELNVDEKSLNVSGKDNEILIRSENISDMVVNLYGIDNATSIIFNDVVAIGLEMAEGNTLTDEIEKMITDTVLEKDPQIRQVLITASKKIFDKIEDIILSLMNGDSYDKHVKEINKIIEKIK